MDQNVKPKNFYYQELNNPPIQNFFQQIRIGSYKRMYIEGNRQNANQGQPRPERLQIVGNRLTKRQMREKIASRQDFILIFGLERKINSRNVPPSQALHYLAVHYKSDVGREAPSAPVSSPNKYHSAQNP